ncbi:MAG: DUF922 domain-containing Zn-dependent protease [Cyanobacteria bacterium Co-bin13]|nr:DUF922 domain-containing Zn-dependent protease [Cyanobacteria bacterium Co-bin13]
MLVLPFKFFVLFLLTLVLSFAGGPIRGDLLQTTEPPSLEFSSESLTLRAEAAPFAPTASEQEKQLQSRLQSRQTQPPAAPTINISHRYYPISGSSAAQLRRQMTQQGPFEPSEGRRYDARTEWLVQWSYRYNRASNRCSVDSLATKVDVTITYPQWTPSSAAPRSLVSEWQRYMTALQNHEDGHKDNGIAAGRDILYALKQLPAYPSCQALDNAANVASQTIIRRYNQRDLDYDHTTNHGSSQGAVFPAYSMASQ